MCDDVKSGKVLARELRGVRVDRVIDVYLISITTFACQARTPALNGDVREVGGN